MKNEHYPSFQRFERPSGISLAKEELTILLIEYGKMTSVVVEEYRRSSKYLKPFKTVRERTEKLRSILSKRVISGSRGSRGMK